MMPAKFSCYTVLSFITGIKAKAVKSRDCVLEFTVSIRQNFSQQKLCPRHSYSPMRLPTYMKQQANYLTCFYHFTKCSHEFQTHKMLTYLNEPSLYPFNNVCINLRTHSELHTKTTSLYYTSHQALNNKSWQQETHKSAVVGTVEMLQELLASSGQLAVNITSRNAGLCIFFKFIWLWCHHDLESTESSVLIARTHKCPWNTSVGIS